MKTINRRLLTVVAACLAVPAFAQTSAREYSLDIERQPLAAALTEFSKQTGLQVGYFPETLTENVFIGPLSGRYTAEAAITQLLLPSGLSFERLNERTIAVTGAESTRSQRYEFSTIERRADHGAAPSFVRLANLRLADVPAAEEEGQQSRTAANVRAADDSKRRRGALEEVIVTAQRREEHLQDVPISIAVLGGDELDRFTVQGVSEALSRVPGVAVEESVQGGATQLTVRGVSAAWATNTGASPIGYYLDTVPFGFVRSATIPNPDVYDLDRVEVLRGPQGTLYGASSVNGVVRVLTKDANLDEFELKSRALTSNTEDGDWSYGGDMAVNVPIVDGKFAARAVLGYQNLGGWIDKPTRKDANDAERRNARLKFNAQLNEQLSVGLSAWISRNDYGARSLSDDNHQDPGPDVEQQTSDFETYGLKVGYDFSAFSLTSTTSYLDYFNDGLVINNFVTGTGLLTEMSAKAFAQEVNLASTHAGPWRWTAGAIYRDGEDRRFQDLGVFAFPQSFKFLSKSWAAYGELTRGFLDGQLEFTAGIRYFEDDVGLREELRAGNAPQPAQYISRDNTFRSTTPRVVLTWKPQDRLTVYTSYSEGFRSGAEQVPGVLVGSNLPPADSDLLKNYELGTKGNLWGGRVGFDTAVYYMDWQDVQVPLLVLVEGIARSGLLNGQSASGMGVDVTLTTRPARGLELGVNASWNDLKMDADAVVGTVVAHGKGDRLNASPEYTIGASADYAFPLGQDGLEGRLSAAFNLTSEREFHTVVTTTQILSETSDPIGVGRVSFAVDSPDRWAAILFVDNINNEQGAVSWAFTESPVRPGHAMRVRPRTIGVQLDYRY